MGIKDRKHRYIEARGEQIRLNRLASLGGRPYIDERLERAANESDLNWLGKDDEGKQVCKGRKNRAAYVNDAARVCQKIEQYLFSSPIERNGIAEDFKNDVTGDGVGIDAFIQDVCREITVAGWCWVQVDRMAWDVEAGQSVASKNESGDRVRWSLWNANDVVDWHFEDDGSLGWVLVQSECWDDSDPQKEASKSIVRTLYRKHEGTVLMSEYHVGGDTPSFQLRVDFPLTGLKTVPFVCVGRPSWKPWWFDDVEAAQAQCLNLGSLHNETLVGSVFPQLVISETTVSKLETKFRAEGLEDGESLKLTREILRGRNHPIVESGEDKGSTRFIEPTGAGLKLIPEEQARIRSLMFENAGMSLFNRETRMIQTAESKQFDQLDTNATLSHRAALLQAAECKMVELSIEFDSSFGKYEPLYPSKFDVFDADGVSTVVQTVMNMPNCTLAMKKMALIAAVRMLQGIATYEKDLVDAALDEIDELEDKGDDDYGIFRELPPLKRDGVTKDKADDDSQPDKADE